MSENLPIYYRNAMTDIMVKTEGLGKRYRVYRKPVQRLMSWVSFGKIDHSKEIWALRDLTLSIREGETVGVIGGNGVGKSTLLKLISKTTFPSHGKMNVHGRVAALLELGAGFHPEFTGRENIRLNAALLGFSGEEIRSREDEIIEFSGLGDSADRPVKTYSSGMVVRLGFSVASHLDPDIFLVDEVLAVGDEAFREKCLERFNAFQESGKTLLFVSHDLRMIRLLCSRVILLDQGQLIADGEVESVVQQYLDIVEKRKVMSETVTSGLSGKSIRKGSGEIRIEEVVLMNGNGDPTDLFRTGEPLEIHIRYRVEQDVKAPLFIFHILRRDGTLCIETIATEGEVRDTTRMGREELEESLPPAVAGETGKWVFRISELLLLGGEYHLNICVYDTDQLMPVTIDEVTRAAKFSVSSGMVTSTGLYHQPGEWKRLK